PYNGAAPLRKLTHLLNQHILIPPDLASPTQANHQLTLQRADRRSHANAADIATFLAPSNPNWHRPSLLTLLNQHLALATREAQDRITKNYSDDVAAFDAIFSQAMTMADGLSNGIIKQFPARLAAVR